MKNSMNHYLTIVTLSILLFFLNYSSIAQSVWIDDKGNHTTVGAELMIPSFDEMASAEFLTSVAVLYSRIRVNDALSIKLDLPISHYSADGDLSKTNMGNPYIGLQFYNMTPGLDLDFGMRLPFAPKNNLPRTTENSGLITGLMIENYNLGIYLPDTYSITANFNYQWESDKGLILKAGGAPDIFMPGGDLNSEFIFNYYGQVLYGDHNFNLGAGLTGLYMATADNLSNDKRTIYNLGLLGSYNFDGVNLGSYFRVPLDDGINDILNFVLGFNIAFRL